MGRAKEIVVKVINSKLADDFVRQNHYSKKVVPNSTLHFGCFLDNRLHGVMSFGSPMIKEKALPLVEGTGCKEMEQWDSFELRLLAGMQSAFRLSYHRIKKRTVLLFQQSN